MKYTALIFFVILLSTSATAQLRGYVTDTANTLSPEEEEQLTALIKATEQSTTAEIAIVTVPSLDGTTIEDFAVDTFAKSGIGKKDVDNGLLIVVAPNERQYRIEVGYGLEGIIPDVVARQIGVKEMEPAFKEGKYGEGLLSGVQTISDILSGNPEVVSKYKNRQISDTSLTYIIAFIFILVILSSFARRGPSVIFFPGFGSGMRGGFGRGGFGGFGGGMSGGGGFSGRW